MPPGVAPLHIRSQMVPMFLGRLAAGGIDLDPVLREFQLPDDVPDLREIEVPLRVVHELPLVAERLLQDPFVGLHLAQALPRGAYGLLEFVIRSSRDLREGASRFVRYHGLLNDLSVMTLEDVGKEAILRQHIPDEPACVGRHANELVLALTVRVVRESIGQPAWGPTRVWFAHPAPPDASALLAYFRVPTIEFERGENGIAVPMRDLDLPLVSADSALFEVLDEQAKRVIASLPDAGDALWPRLREQIRLALRDGAPRLEAIAPRLGTSARTLQRRLAERGTSFQDLVDEIRRDLACMYIERDALSPLEVAFLLGYSDRRAFLRAFKRWTGKTPGEFRRGART